MKKQNSFRAYGVTTIMLTLLIILAVSLTITCEDSGYQPQVSISVNPETVTLGPNDDPVEIQVSVVKSSRIKENYLLTWISANDKVATVYEKGPNGKPITDAGSDEKEITKSEIVTLLVSPTGKDNQATTINIKLINAYDYEENPREIVCDVIIGNSTAITSVSFNELKADGTSSTDPTTTLTLTFSKVINNLSADDITLSPPTTGFTGSISKGTLSGSTGTTSAVYTLPIGVTTTSTSAVKLSVAVGAKDGYNITGGPRSVNVFGNSSGGGNIVSFTGLTASPGSPTPSIVLTFDKPITDLKPDDITFSTLPTGVTSINKGTLTLATGNNYTLIINGFTTGGTLGVTVAKTGYTISGSPKTVTINGNSSTTTVTLNSVTQDGDSTKTTTTLTLTFDQAIPNLGQGDIVLSGTNGNTTNVAVDGNIYGSGPTYTLNIKNVTKNETLTVTVTPTGYIVSGSPKTVDIYYVPTPGAQITVQWEAKENETLMVLNPATATYTPSTPLQIDASGITGAVSFEWYLDGEITTETNNKYTFTKTDKGVHIVTLVVKMPDGKVYSADATITVN